MKKYKKMKNDYYEFLYDEKYQKEIEKIFEYSTKKLIENLKYFGEESYDNVISVSFFDNREEFINRIHEIDKNANPPIWASGCFYGGENQILFPEGDINKKFFTPAHETCHLLFLKYVYSNYKNNKRIVWLDESFAANFSGEVQNNINNGIFINQIKKYIGAVLPNMNDISFENKNIKTKEYNAYDFFHIIGRYLIETNNKDNLLELYKDEGRVLNLGETILGDSIDYFIKKYNLLEDETIKTI